MRDIKRIMPMLKKIYDIWKISPDLRFGQLVYCIMSQTKQDMFYIEDDDFVKLIETYQNIRKSV